MFDRRAKKFVLPGFVDKRIRVTKCSNKWIQHGRKLCQLFLIQMVCLLSNIFFLKINVKNNFFLWSNQCGNKIDKISKRCYNRACKSVNGQYKKVFDITVSVSDHTSALRNVRVSSKLFEKIFGYSVSVFLFIQLNSIFKF